MAHWRKMEKREQEEEMMSGEEIIERNRRENEGYGIE